MKKYITKQSSIKGAGKGLFTNASFKKGEVIGLAHVDDQPASEIGRNHNHNEKNPTAYSKKIDNKRFIYASRNLKPGEEITTNYRMQPELEQPEDFMRKGGLHKFVNGGKSNVKFISSKDGVKTPIYKKVDIRPSKIHGNGLFTKETIKKNEPIGICHVKNKDGQLIPSTILGMYNHNKKTPNVYEINKGDHVIMMPLRDISPGEELTADYDMVPIEGLQDSSSFSVRPKKQDGGNTESNGETYKYLGRPDSLYKKSFNGKWLISNKSTGNKFVPIEDPKGSRTKELDKNAVTVSSLNKKRMDHLIKLHKEINFPKEFIDLKDTRTVRATTGEKINPNVDLKADKYNKVVIDSIIKKAKAVGVDPSTMLAIALQETNFGKKDANLGHALYGDIAYPYGYIDFYKEKLNEAKRAKIDNELLQIQYYNGLGTVYPETEEDYHGFKMQKIYGVPLPASGINMRKNPLYGKQIIDLRDNVILKNLYIQKALKQKQKGGDNTDAMNGMMKARLAYANEFGNPAAERMINLPDNPYQFDNGDTGTHYMASYDNYAVPQIQDENGVLQLGDYGPESNEAIRFDSDEDANYFAENYKDVSPGFIEAELDEDEIEEYRRGGYIVEEIDNYQDGGVYTVKGSKGAYKKVNGKWQVDWNRSGKYQPLSKGDVKARTAVLDKMAKPLYDKDYDEMVAYKNLSAEDKINKFEPKKEATKEDYESITNKLSKIYKPENTKLQSVNMVYPERGLIGPGGGAIGIARNAAGLGIKGLSKAMSYIPAPVSGALNAYFGAEGIKEFADPNSLTRKSMSRAYDNPTKSNIGDAAFDVGMNSLNFVGLPFSKTFKGTKNLIKGFKGIPKQLSGSSNTPIVNTKMGFDFGMDMSKYEIKNPDYFTQLLNTYDSKALSTTNKKFYKDLIKSVKNQNNIATERQYGELQRLKTGNFNFGKKGYANGGTTNDYIELDLTPEEIQKYKNDGYVVEELPEMQSGGSPSQVWYQYTGTPWSEARKKGLTDGSKKQNTELRKKILAGEFGKPKFSNEEYQNIESNYDRNIEKMVAQGKTLDQLVKQKVGTRAGLKSRFPELFKTKSRLDDFVLKNYNSSNSSSSKNKNTKSRWGNVTVESNDGKPIYRKDDYIDMVQSKDSKTKAEGLAMQAEHKKQLQAEKIKKQKEDLFDAEALLANAKTQREKIKDAPKIKYEPIPGSMAAQFSKQDFNKKYDPETGEELKNITYDFNASLWDMNKGLLEQKWFPYSEEFIKSQKYKPEGFFKMFPDPSTKEAQAYLKAEQAKENAKKEEEAFQYREDMIKENPETSIEEIDQFIQDQKSIAYENSIAGPHNNYNDGPVQLVYPEKYVAYGPSRGILGGLLRNPYVMGAGNLYFGAQGISEWADSDSDLRKSISKAWDDPTWSNIGDFGYELGANALNFSALPFGKYYKNYKNIGKTPIPKKYGPFKPRKPKTINLNQNPRWLQLPKYNSKGYLEYKKYQDGGNVSKLGKQKIDNYKLDKEIVSDLSKEEINKLVSQGYIVEQIN
jgi:hypothetical protein